MDEARRVYRPGATIVPLFIWAVLLSGAGLLALDVARGTSATPEARTVATSMAVLALLFGPLAFAAFVLRLCLVTVRVDARDGLLLSGREPIPWKDIQSVELREAALREFIRASPLVLFLTAGCMALIHFVILPSFVLFTPWHQRVLIRLRDGRTIVLRDLRGAKEFMRDVAPRVGPLA